MKPQAMIDVIQAYMDNKNIQVKSHSSEVGWYTIKSVDNFNPDFGVCDYRVKPDFMPRDGQIVFGWDNDCLGYPGRFLSYNDNSRHPYRLSSGDYMNCRPLTLDEIS